jgi:phosphoribosylanthranilate isomerase
MIKPYVGLTGINTRIEAQIAAEEFTKAGFSNESSHIPMYGVLMSYRTLNDILPKELKTPNIRYPNWRPIKSRMKELAKQGLPMIHYTTKEKDTLPGQIKKIFKELFHDGNLYDENICRAVQLNIVWPKPGHLEEIVKEFPELNITFQLSSRAQADYSPQEIAEKLSPYKDFISYLLIDPSGGRGEEFDINKSLNIYNALKEKFPSLVLGFAGGLTGDNVKEKCSGLISKVGKDFCIDAEGGLRVRESCLDEQYNDDLDLEKVRKYISASGEMFLNKKG